MKEQVLKSMMQVVDTTMTCSQSDFYKWDLRTLASQSEAQPFLWSAGKSSTLLLTVDVDAKVNELSANEMRRFSFMQSPFVDVDYFCESVESNKVFYYDGEALKELAACDARLVAQEDFKKMLRDVVMQLRNKFPNETNLYNKCPDIRFASDNVRNEVRRLLKSNEGGKLLQVLRSFRRWERRARNHEIVINRDFMDKSFVFAEIVNGEGGINGGIIYNGGRWTKHT